MANKYQHKYRISSARLKEWNYGAEGSYFITICTKRREHFFGEIINNEMQLSYLGKVVEDEWLKTFELRPDMKLEMGEFIVMPNHFHGIIIIGENEYNTGRDAMHGVSTFGPQSKNLGSILRGFKSAVTTNARKRGNTDFNWQPRFHDHIIRDEASFERIQYYIANNPANWKNDKFYGHEE